MSDPVPNLDSLFEAAVEIESAEKLAEFLDKSCGTDRKLRQQVEELLQSHEQAGSFLEKPPAELEGTAVPDVSGDNLAASLEAGLTPSFRKDEAMVIGSSGHSILKMLGQTIDVPHVTLRDAHAESDDPIQRPNSMEIPDHDAGSRYRLDGEIARGGMGAIIKGRDTDLGRDLAIKVLLDEHTAKPEVIQRFVEEAQIGGQLQHPGIAPVYELGQFSDSRPFFSMKLVKGQTLSKLLADRKDPAEDRGRLIGIFEQVCQTMAYAHSRGVIHRDLKPANIMVGAFGEVQVMDWGLAKVLSIGGVADEKKLRDTQQGKSIIQTLRSVGSDTPGPLGSIGSQTQMGSVMGTPAYMSPEQALGEIDRLDERTDVFGLGAILCEVLTGMPPYVAEDATQVYRQASRGKLEDCFERLQNSGVEQELIGLAKSTLAVEPMDRPSDANAVAEAVSHYLSGVEERLRQAELANAEAQARAEEEIRRRKLHFAIAGLMLLVAIVSVLAVVRLSQLVEHNKMLAGEANDQRDAAEVAAVEVRERESVLRQGLYASLIPQADVADRKHNKSHVRKLLARCPDELRNWEWDHLAWRTRPRYLFTLPARSRPLRFTTDGEILTTHDGNEGVVRAWDLESSKLVREYPIETGGFLDEISGIEQFVVSHDKDEMWLSNIVTGKQQWYTGREPLSTGTHAVSSPDGSLLATMNRDSLIQMWDTTRKDAKLPSIRNLGNFSAEFSPEGARLAVSDTIFDASTLEPLVTLATADRDPMRQRAIAWSPDGQRIATSYLEGRVSLWDASTGAKLRDFLGHDGGISDVAFSPDGNRIVSAGSDRTIRISDLSDAGSRKMQIIGSHDTGTIWWVGFSPDGQKVISASDDIYYVWDTVPITNVDSLSGHDGVVNTLDFGPDGKTIASVGIDGNIRLWDVAARHEKFKIPTGTPLSGIAYHPDGKTVVVSGGGSIQMWDLAKRKVVRPISDKSGGLALSPNGRYLAAGYDGNVRVWDLFASTEPYEFKGSYTAWLRMAWSPDSQHIVTRSDNYLREAGAGNVILSDVTIRDALTRKVLRTFPGGGHAFAFSQTGQLLASGRGSEISLFDPKSGAILAKFSVQNSAKELAFLDDERLLSKNAFVSSSVTVLDARTGHELMDLSANTGEVTDVAVSPDGLTIATGSTDGTIQLWETGPPSMQSSERAVVRSAHGVFERAVETLAFHYEIVESLENDDALGPAVRAAAIRIAETRRDRGREIVRAEQLHNDSLNTARDSDGEASRYQAALKDAAIACRVLPESAIFRSTLGITQYRVGQFDVALKTLEHAESKFAQMHPGRDYPPVVAFTAMTLYQLGRVEQAHIQLDRLDAWFDDDRWGGNLELYEQYQREAQSVINGSLSEPK